jgi:anti-sigma factor RsiW
MNCPEAKRTEAVRWRMSLALDRMLPASEESELQAHLAHCPSCRAEWEALQAVSHLLGQVPLASPGVDLALRVEERLRLQGVRRRWALGLVASWLWLGLALTSLVGSSALLGWLLLQQPVLVSAGVQVLARLLLTCQATLRAVWLVVNSLSSSWLATGISGCLASALMLVCLWAWLALGWQQPRTRAVRGMLVR